VRLYSRPGNDLSRRFPLLVDALARLRSRSCIIDGEAVACDDNGVASFDLVRHHPTNDSDQRASVAMWLRGRESSYMPDMARKRAFRIGRSRTGLGLFATAPIKKELSLSNTEAAS
jgi:hypothetical protein